MWQKNREMQLNAAEYSLPEDSLRRHHDAQSPTESLPKDGH